MPLLTIPVKAKCDFDAYFGNGTVRILAGTVGTMYAVDSVHNEAGVDFETCCWCPINLIEVQREYQSVMGNGSEKHNRISGDSDGLTA